MDLRPESIAAGQRAYNFAQELFPLCRSITGPGTLETLERIKKKIPKLELLKIASGTRVYDWTVPEEWHAHNAWIKDPKGKKIVDFSCNNLHLVNYSRPFHGRLSLAELSPHLYTLVDQPDFVPYVTSYYSPRWGFCMSEHQKQSLTEGVYEVYIDTEFKNGYLNYAELSLPGRSHKEIFFSTYVCHPSMANNELSGPTLLTELIQWIETLKDRRLSYRFVFIPETIGSIVYISRQLELLKSRMIAGFNLTCVGDERAISFLPSRKQGSLADRVALHVLRRKNLRFDTYKWQDRGSDERQYCWPGVDLPVVSVMRSKYGTYPEYHTSADNMEFISAQGLGLSFEIYQDIISSLELNATPKTEVICEPMLGPRGLYQTLGNKANQVSSDLILNLLSDADGSHDLIELAERNQFLLSNLSDLILTLEREGLWVLA